jgi:hypothetical protein
MRRVRLLAAIPPLFAWAPASAQQMTVDPQLAQGIADAVSLSGIRQSSSMQITRQTLSTVNARVGRVSEDSRGDVYAAGFYNDNEAGTRFGDLDLGPTENGLVSSLKAASGVTSDEASRVRSDLYQFLVGADYQVSKLSVGGLASYARFDVTSSPGDLLGRLGAAPNRLEGNAWLGAAYANYLFTPSFYATAVAIYGEANSEDSDSSSRYSGLEGGLTAIATRGSFTLQGRAALRHLEIEFRNPALTRARQQFPQFERIFEREVSTDTAIIGADVTWLMSRRVQPFLRTSYEISVSGPRDEGLYSEGGLTFNLNATTAVSLAVQWSSFSDHIDNSGIAVGFRSAF